MHYYHIVASNLAKELILLAFACMTHAHRQPSHAFGIIPDTIGNQVVLIDVWVATDGCNLGHLWHRYINILLRRQRVQIILAAMLEATNLAAHIRQLLI